MRTVFGLACAALALAGAAPAAAATLFTQGAPTAELESPGSFSVNFDAGGGVGTIDFTLEGIRTLDGQGTGSFDDRFTLTLNSTAIASGLYRLGGGGTDATLIGPAPVVTFNGFGSGGTAVYSLSNVAFANGANTLTFSYSGVGQGIGDEAWRIRGLTVNGDPQTSAVPEPATWAMMLIGFGMVGAGMRRRVSARVQIA